MKKFLANCGLFAALFVCVTPILLFFAMNIAAPQYNYEYNAAAIDKLTYLKSINTPKIILIGNSNLAFGIKSPMLEQASGMKVVNLGTSIWLDNRFHENIAKYNINKGDIVVICYSNYGDDSKIPDHIYAWVTIENHWYLYPLVRHDKIGMIKAFPEYFAKTLERYFTHSNKKPENTCYARDAFNKYGDIIYPRLKSEYTFGEETITPPPINDTCVNRLNKFNKYCQKRGATLVVAGYPIGKGKFTADKKLFIEAYKTLQSKLDFPVISNIEDYFFPYSDFYNTSLHLIDSAAERRTQQLIKDLQNANLIPR